MKARMLGLAAATATSAVALLLAGCGSPNTSASAPVSSQARTGDPAAMTATVEAVENLPDLSGKSVAFVAACATENAYCRAAVETVEKTAAKTGARLTIFNGAFDPTTQHRVTQDAVQQGGFDGYIFEPVADTSGCADFKLLKQTGAPVVNINQPMCGNRAYTEGTVGFVAIQTEPYYYAHLTNAFDSCEGKPCKVAAIGGYLGTDLHNNWVNAIKAASAEYPNVEIVANEPGNFDPTTAYSVIQNALTMTPDLTMVVSSWDDMTRGAEQAIAAAGKTSGTEVRVYSVGGTQHGVDKVVAGTWNETSVLLPRREIEYGFAQLAKAITTGESTPGFTFLAEAPVVTQGPGSPFITRENADKFEPEF